MTRAIDWATVRRLAEEIATRAAAPDARDRDGCRRRARELGALLDGATAAEAGQAAREAAELPEIRGDEHAQAGKSVGRG